ncbi:MAG: deoxyguanosinetriphosphate triphosphohydrolase [Rhodoluna sp.]
MTDFIDGSYEATDQERFVAETRSGFERRTEFARDRARVLHSSALRRLGAKTQVLEPAGGDFARTRLTHSLEVAQVGREMASELGVSPDVVDMACLAHDLGHPPFGHNGERALNEWASDIGGFEGNAQTLRLLTRLEPKVFSDNGLPAGLNLTRAALDATCKYPWSAERAVIDSGADRSSKFGVYQDDMPVFEWMRAGAPEGKKCIEAQIMDFADDVAYSVHDFEDAIVSGFIKLEEVAAPSQRGYLLSQIKVWAGDQMSVDQLDQALTRLQASQYWPREFDGSTRALASLKNLTSAMIGAFVGRVTDATLSSASSATLTRYRANVVETPEVLAEISVLKGLVSVFLMSHESRRPFYEWQRAILKELADALLNREGVGLDQVCQSAWMLAQTDIERKRVIVDQVALLTDQSALAMHDKLVTRGL